MADFHGAAEMKANLEKRASFEKAARDLETLTRTDAGFSSSAEAMLLAKRCVAILRARHTNPSFWTAGHSFVKVGCAKPTHSQDPAKLSC